MNRIVSISGLLLAFYSCTKEKIPADESLLGLNYYPTLHGRYVIYDVDSIIYNELPRDTVIYKYRIKERIADNFIDNQGQPAIRLERFIKKQDPLKPFDSIAWTMKEVWMVNAGKKSIQVVEGNVRYTKLIFPIEEKAGWNGNANNTIGEWLYFYDYIERSEVINGVKLDKVLKVKQKEYRTLISYQNYFEKYASGIGLVFREMTDLYSNTIIPNVPVENRIENGFTYKQTLVSYGTE